MKLRKFKNLCSYNKLGENMDNFKKRINLNTSLSELAKNVCEKYKLGEFKSCRAIKIGYEDFNFILTTDSDKYVVKVFNKNRTDEDCENLAKRASLPYEKGFSCPKIYKCGRKLVYMGDINGNKYRLLVMEYINGKDFYSLQKLPTDFELEEIAHEMAKLNNIKFNPPFIYDLWAIVNYEKEYEKNIHLIKGKDKKFLDKALTLFKSVDFSKLQYGFVHGDIIKTNVLKDKSGKLYFIDFSVSNYLPRIVDIAVTIGDLCFDVNNANETKRKIQLFLNAYESRAKLSDYERECLGKFLYCHQAITVLETTREKIVENNNSDENELYASDSKKALILLNKTNLI